MIGFVYYKHYYNSILVQLPCIAHFTYSHTYIKYKVKLAADSVALVIKTSDKNQKLLTLVKITTLETLGTSCSLPVGQMVVKFLLQLV